MNQSSERRQLDDKKEASFFFRARIWLRRRLLVLVFCLAVILFVLLPEPPTQALELGLVEPPKTKTTIEASEPSLLRKEPQAPQPQDYREACIGTNVQDGTFARTKTAVPFDMSVHATGQDVWVSGSIVKEGCWECDLVQIVIDTLQKHKGSFLLDIGGNIGMFSLSVAAAGYQAFAFEPLQANYNHICRTVVKNSFQDRVHLFTTAATRDVSRVELKLDPKNMGGTSSRVVEHVADSKRIGVDFAPGIPVDSVRDVFPKDRPFALKIDVEGVEIDALMGAIQVLQDGDLKLALMELRPANLARQAEDTTAVFSVFYFKGLKPFLIKGGKWVPMEGDWREWKTKYGIGVVFDMGWKEP